MTNRIALRKEILKRVWCFGSAACSFRLAKADDERA